MGRWAILNGVLLVILALLGLQIAWTWSRSLPTVETVARGTDPPPQDEGKPDAKGGGPRRDRGKRPGNEKVEQQPAVLVTTIVNKDLFDPSRQKPSEEVKPPPPKEVGPPPNLTLVGVRMIGKDREVLVTDAGQGNQQKRLRIGDQLGGYTLKTIQPSRVTLASAAGDVVTLNLAVEKSAAAAPTAPRPPGVPVPPRPGQQPPGMPAPPAVGAQSPAAGIQPRAPRAPAHPQRPGAPGMPVTPPAAGMGVAPGAPAAQPGFQPPGAPPQAPPQTIQPNLPAAVREKLEQLKGN